MSLHEVNDASHEGAKKNQKHIEVACKRTPPHPIPISEIPRHAGG